jgi:hypothetical protein
MLGSSPEFSLFRKMSIAPFVIVPLTVFFLWEVLFQNNRSPEIILGTLVLGATTLMLPTILIRRIVFATGSFSIEKFLWPTKIIDYSDILDIGLTIIKTRKGNLSIYGMTNSDELSSILTELIELGKINPYQIENQLTSQETLSRIALIPSGIVAFVLWYVALTFWPVFKSMSQELSCMIFWGVTYFFVYQLMRIRSESLS